MGRRINVSNARPSNLRSSRLNLFGQADSAIDRTTHTRKFHRGLRATGFGFGGRFGAKSVCFILLGRLQDHRTLDGREGHENNIWTRPGKLINKPLPSEYLRNSPAPLLLNLTMEARLKLGGKLSHVAAFGLPAPLFGHKGETFATERI
jgi:hypothetical protein